MKYYSLNKLSPNVDFRQATINGQAPDKGLYFPSSIPQIPKRIIENIRQYSRKKLLLKLFILILEALFRKPF